MLVVHECLSFRRHLGLNDWRCFADFRHAFPRVDRADLLTSMFKGAKVQQGAFALLGGIFKSDTVYVFLSGCSNVEQKNGLPEGSSLGPTCYTIIPDSLVRVLVDGKCGIGIGCQMPAEWQVGCGGAMGHPMRVWSQC